MKNLNLFDLIIGIVTIIGTYNNAFCGHDKLIPVNDMEDEHQQVNIPNMQNVVQAINMFNVLHQNINQFEQNNNNNIANLEYNYRFERYLDFRRQLGQIRARVDGYIFDANIYAHANLQDVHIPQIIRILSDYFYEYDIFLMTKQMGYVQGINEPIFNLQ